MKDGELACMVEHYEFLDRTQGGFWVLRLYCMVSRGSAFSNRFHTVQELLSQCSKLIVRSDSQGVISDDCIRTFQS